MKDFKPKHTPFVVLGILSLVCSRILFSLFNDPEGANLLVVVVMALIMYFLSLTPYILVASLNSQSKFLGGILIQIVSLVTFWVYLK